MSPPRDYSRAYKSHLLFWKIPRREIFAYLGVGKNDDAGFVDTISRDNAMNIFRGVGSRCEGATVHKIIMTRCFPDERVFRR